MSEKSPKQLLHEKRDFWQQQVLDWQESKLSQVEHCRQHNLSKTRFSYWSRRFNLPVILICARPLTDCPLQSVH